MLITAITAGHVMAVLGCITAGATAVAAVATAYQATIEAQNAAEGYVLMDVDDDDDEEGESEKGAEA